MGTMPRSTVLSRPVPSSSTARRIVEAPGTVFSGSHTWTTALSPRTSPGSVIPADGATGVSSAATPAPPSAAIRPRSSIWRASSVRARISTGRPRGGPPKVWVSHPASSPSVRRTGCAGPASGASRAATCRLGCSTPANRTGAPVLNAAWSACDWRQVARNDWLNVPTARARVSRRTAEVARVDRRPTSQAASGETTPRPRAATDSASRDAAGSRRTLSIAPASRTIAGPATHRAAVGLQLPVGDAGQDQEQQVEAGTGEDRPAVGAGADLLALDERAGAAQQRTDHDDGQEHRDGRRRQPRGLGGARVDGHAGLGHRLPPGEHLVHPACGRRGAPG